MNNIGHTYESIEDMGKRLADEIVEYCLINASDLLYPDLPGRISFIGHSMGGLIIRRALEVESHINIPYYCIVIILL